MPEPKAITITVNHRRVTLDTPSVQYVFIDHNTAEFHLSNDARYRTRIPIKTLEPMLGDEFIRIHRNYLVAVRAIHDISDRVYLNNGESLAFAQRRKKDLTDELRQRRRGAPLADPGTPGSRDADSPDRRSEKPTDLK